MTSTLTTTEIAEYVKRWGCSASIALLDPDCEIFKTPEIDGLIGYRTKGRHVFVFGDPVCNPAAKSKLAKAFDEYCKNQKKNIVYTQISDQFGTWALEFYKGALIEIGEELYVNPDENPMEGSEARMLRKKVNHAIHEGTIVEEYTDIDPKKENAMEDVKHAWLKSRKGPQIFLSHIHLFENRTGKRWFYAKQGDKIVGLSLLNKIDSKQGWVLNQSLTTPDAPHGTTELLVTSILNQLRNEKCHYLTFGVVPSSEIKNISGLNKFSSWLAKKAFKSAIWVFRLNGKRVYWQKYKPNFDKSHILFTKQNVGFCDIINLLCSLNARL